MEHGEIERKGTERGRKRKTKKKKVEGTKGETRNDSTRP